MSEETQTCCPDCQLLNDSELEKIAEQAAEKAIKKLTNQVYLEVGKNVISKFVYVVGACSLGLYLWLKSKGVI